METQSDNLKKIPVAPKTRKSNKQVNLYRKAIASSSGRTTVSVSKKKELPPLTPLHRLKRFKAIRDKNLKNKGFKISLDNKMEGVSIAEPTTIEIKEKINSIEVSQSLNIEPLITNQISEIKKTEENGVVDTETKENIQHKEIDSEDNSSESLNVVKNEENKTKTSFIEKESESIQNESIDSQTESEEKKNYLESLGESEASVCLQPVVTNSSSGPTDDEEEVEILQSKPDSELDEVGNSVKLDEQSTAENSFIRKEDTQFSPFLNASITGNYGSSYSSTSRICGRRPVRDFSRKRKFEDDENDHKSKKSPSIPSPEWKFFPSSMNFWTPRTTPFQFESSIPAPNLNDSMAVNVGDDVLEDSDLFVDAEGAPQSSKKSRWGCAIM